MIERIAHISHTDPVKFDEALTTFIKEIQDEGLRAEVQYQMHVDNNKTVVYGALILGRKQK